MFDLGLCVYLCCQVEVQSLLVAEVVGGAKTIAQKSIVKNLNHLWEQVSIHSSLSEGTIQSPSVS